MYKGSKAIVARHQGQGALACTSTDINTALWKHCTRNTIKTLALREHLSYWDIAAGILLVQEAGGSVTDFSGGNNALFGRELVAAGDIHNDLLKSIQKYW